MKGVFEDQSTVIRQVTADISALPQDWHGAGTMGAAVLHAIARHTAGREIAYSAETGSGKTTLLFSHLSRHHTVFAVEGDNRSITVVRNSPLLRAAAVQFIEGPTQATLPHHSFADKLQLVLIDGPHGYPFPELGPALCTPVGCRRSVDCRRHSHSHHPPVVRVPERRRDVRTGGNCRKRRVLQAD